jgi:hypothetical protein
MIRMIHTREKTARLPEKLKKTLLRRCLAPPLQMSNLGLTNNK